MDPWQLTTADFDPAGTGLTVGLASIAAAVPGVAANRTRILAALEAFRERQVNLAVFPEFSLTGVFWEDEVACRPYMEGAAWEHQRAFIESSIRPLLDDTLRLVVLSVLRPAEEPPDGRFFNSTLIVGRDSGGRPVEAVYDKAVPAGIEGRYLAGSGGRRLVLDTPWGRLGFLTCYDLCFPELLLGYHLADRVDGMVLTAAWRGPAPRSYPGLGIEETQFYGKQWEMLVPAQAALSQAWFFAANAVGRHGLSGAEYWGGSGVWAPSGLPLLRAAPGNEQLLVLRHIPLRAEVRRERAEFDYRSDRQAAGLSPPSLPPAVVVDAR
jgi:predicted amidohydrolase